MEEGEGVLPRMEIAALAECRSVATVLIQVVSTCRMNRMIVGFGRVYLVDVVELADALCWSEGLRFG